MTEPHPTPTPPLARLIARIDPRTSWMGYLVAAGLTLALALAMVEPDESRGVGAVGRFAFWAVHVALALTVFEIVQMLFGHLRLAGRLPPLLQIAVPGLLAAPVFALAALLIEPVIVATGIAVEADQPTFASFVEEVQQAGLVALLFWVLLNTPRLIVIGQQGEAGTGAAAGAPGPVDEPADAGQRAADPALIDMLERLPRRIGRDIVAMSAELHYLRVHTRLGEALILMPFGRAVAAMRVVPGLVIHRSHWVALAHVAELAGSGDSLACRLDTGVVLPVSRSRRAELRAALAVRDRLVAEQAAERLAAGNGAATRSV